MLQDVIKGLKNPIFISQLSKIEQTHSLNTIQYIHLRSKASIILNVKTRETFQLTSGGKVEYFLSPLLLIIVLEVLIKEVRKIKYCY